MAGCVGGLRSNDCFYFRSHFALLWIVVIINAVIIQVDSSFIRISAAIGLKAKLLCSTEITGSIHVQWLDPSGTTLTYDETVETGDSRFKINHSYLKEWNLEIDNVRRSDAGNYTCSMGPVPFITKVIELVVVVAPTIVRSSGDVASPVGSLVTFTCEASGEPQPVVVWSRYSTNNGTKFALSADGSIFNISAVSLEDAGAYECEASNNIPPPAFGRMKLEVLFAPEITLLFHEMSQKKGDSTLLTCLVKANPAKKLYWEKNGTHLVPSNKYQVQQWMVGEYQSVFGILITALFELDYGNYKCIAINDYGQAEGEILLQEYKIDRMHVLATPKDSVARVGEDVQLECSVHGLLQNVSLIWWHILANGEYKKIFESNPVEASETSTLNQFVNSTVHLDNIKYEIWGHYSLHIRLVDFSDSGTYVCDIQGQQNFSAEITVVDTSLYCVNNKTRISDGDSVLLICSLAYRGVTRNWYVTWLHDEEPVSSIVEDGDDLIKRTLQLNASYPQSTGVYRCAVSAQQMDYFSSCKVQLTVFSSEMENVFPGVYCDVRSNVTQFMDTDSDPVVIIIFANITIAFLIIFIVTICCLTMLHQKELAKYKKPQLMVKLSRNGSLDMEMTPLTSSSPQPSA